MIVTGWSVSLLPWCCLQTPPELWRRWFPSRRWESAACSWCSLPFPADGDTSHSSEIIWTNLLNTTSLRRSRPAGSSQTPPCSSSGVGGWGRWWGRRSSRGALWLGERQTRCFLRPASGCPAPPVDRRGHSKQVQHTDVLGTSCRVSWNEMTVNEY